MKKHNWQRGCLWISAVYMRMMYVQYVLGCYLALTLLFPHIALTKLTCVRCMQDER